MTPTIQCGPDDHQSMQMSPPSVFCSNLFYQQNRQTSPASDRTAFSRTGVRTNHLQRAPNLRDRRTTYKNSRRNTSYASAGLKPDVKRLLSNNNSNSDDEDTASDEHLNFMRKRRALLLVTIQTMTLFHENQILERKLSALHKSVMIQIQKENEKNNESASD